MKALKLISFLTLMFIFMASFSQCSSTYKLQKEAPATFGEVYCQDWAAGVQGGGGGLNLFIPIGDQTMTLDSVYFRGKAVKLELNPNSKIYVGRFVSGNNAIKDVVLSSDPKEEYGNQMPSVKTTIPFKLKDDECVVSYLKNKTILYYKITNIKQKKALHYPSAPPNKN